MSTIYLLRHCDYDNPRGILPGRLPVPLSAEGLVQAEKLRSHFATEKIARIYSSAVLRCQQTATIIADNRIPIVYDQRLLETLSAYQGYWAREEWDHFFAHQADLGGETLVDIRKRVLGFYQEVLASLPDQETVIVCSHGDPLQQLYAGLKQLPLPSNTQNYPETLEYGWLQKGEFLKL
jgi:probable phosphoglycerate mutase